MSPAMSTAKPTVVFLGAGSVVFARQLLADLFRFDDLPELRIVLHDIDGERLAVARGTADQVAERFGRSNHYPKSRDQQKTNEITFHPIPKPTNRAPRS